MSADTSQATDELLAEQGVVNELYARLDALRAHTGQALAQVRAEQSNGHHQNRSERDAFAALYAQRLAQLNAVEDRLCFGRLDLADGDRRYIGRIGLADDDQRRLLVDWRAQAATPFYQATAAHPGDVVLRRHLITHGRAVEGVEDDVLNLDALDDTAKLHLNGEGALMAAVSAQRTGRMGDIVATIQSEQDRIIRAELPGVLVVEGGPGTGKTAVALHRAAYLLYASRERLSRSGILVVGPSPVFLRYIERVLPSLGETGVLMLTAGELFPGVRATLHDGEQAARLKGDLRMAQAISNAIRDRQRVPAETVRINLDGTRIQLTPRSVGIARERARATGAPHNEARVTFVKDLLNHLADQVGKTLGSRLAPEDRSLVIADLRADIDVRRALNLAWMPLTATDVVARLLSDERRLASAAPWLTPAERRVLLRDRNAPFTIDDVPLLDEAAELLGTDPSVAEAAARAAAAQRSEELEYAKRVLSMTGMHPMLDAETLADRQSGPAEYLTVAERAEGDRAWAFGHIVVDEAQELSPMMWRVLGRRNPSRSMTVVGDLAQTRSAAGAEDWGAVLAPLVEDRWQLEQLTVSYRTPAQIMRLAGSVLAANGVTWQVPTSVREGEHPPQATAIATLTDPVVPQAISAELAAVHGGRVAVICAEESLTDLIAVTRAGLPDVAIGTGNTALDSPVAVLSVDQAKGLEFDAVVLVEPADILNGGLRGINDLYVAMTRPTQRLHVLHAKPLPAGWVTTD